MSCKLEEAFVSQEKVKVDIFYSDVQSSTIKQEEAQTTEQIMIKLRKKICRKVFQILTKELKLGIMDSQEIVVKFEAVIFSVFPDDTAQYISAVKNICNRIRVRI